MKNLLIAFFVILIFGLISFVSANDLSPYAGTKIVLDNFDRFPDYVFFISNADYLCYTVGEGTNDSWEVMKNYSEQLEVRGSEDFKECNLRIFDDKGELTNFFISYNGVRGQCVSPVYAIKKSDFNESFFRGLSVCNQSIFLNQYAYKVTSTRYSISSASSYFVYLVEEHFVVDLKSTQQEPSYIVEKSNLSLYLSVLGAVALLVILVILIVRYKKE